VPSTGLIDLSSFRLQGDISVQGAGNSQGFRVGGTHLFVDRFSANLGGVNVGTQCQEYGKIAEAIKRCTMSDDAQNSHELGNMNALIPGDVALEGDGFREWGYWPCSVCQLNSTGLLDVSTVGNCELEIQFNSLTPYLLQDATPTGTATGVTISNLRAYVSVVDLENGLEYAREQQALLSGDKAIKQVVPHIVTAPQVANSSNNYNISSGNVDMLMAIGFKNNPANGSDRYKFQDVDGAGQAANNKYFFQVGSVSLPQYGFVDNAYIGAIHSCNSWGGYNRANTNSLYKNLTTGAIDKDAYITDNHIIMENLTLAGPGWSNRLLSGVSTQSSNSVGRFENTGYQTGGAQSFILGGLCTGILSIRGGGSVSFEA